MSDLPREVLCWLQRLDLNCAITNPKRDFANGFLFAEIIAWYHPKLVRITSFENGLKLSTKTNNWEQLFKLFGKIGFTVSKYEYEPVIHCAAGAAVALVKKVYCFFTKRALDCPAPVEQDMAALPDFSRPTATWLLKNPELERVQDKVTRIYHAVGVLEHHKENLAMYRYHNAHRLIASQRLAFSGSTGTLETEETQPGNVTELQVKTLRRDLPTLAARDKPVATQVVKRQVQMRWARTAVNGLDLLPSLEGAFKPCIDIVKPLIFSLIPEQLDSTKEPLTEFIELSLRDVLEEALCVKVLELFAQRASLLVDTCLKSPVEMWKLWTIMMPLLSEAPDTSPLFETAIVFYKKLGEAMRDADADLTQQLFCGVGLPSLAGLLVNAAGKREAICEIFSSYITDGSASHLNFLRELKNRLVPANNTQGNSLYIMVLSYLAHTEAFDENLLDLYLYYSIIGLQTIQPRVRVASLAILCIIAQDPFPQARAAIYNLVPHICCLVHDRWWEVQAQLCVLSSFILRALPEQKDDEEQGPENLVETVLSIVGSVFNVTTQWASTSTLQIGLCAFAQNLLEYPLLRPIYLQVLLKQPEDMRRRLLSDGVPARMAYVIGASSRMYEEVCIPDIWPSAEMAKSLVELMPPPEFDAAYFQVLLACFRNALTGDLWLETIQSMKEILANGLVSPHNADAFLILHAIWDNPEMLSETLDVLEPVIVEALGTNPKVDTSAFWENMREQGKGGVPQGAEKVMKSLQSRFPATFKEQNFVF